MADMSPHERLALDAVTDAYANALIVALTDTAKALGSPDIHAALTALAYAEARILSGLNLDDRLKARNILINKLDGFTRDFVHARVLETAQPAGRG